jgi:hypothetical protein
MKNDYPVDKEFIKLQREIAIEALKSLIIVSGMMSPDWQTMVKICKTSIEFSHYMAEQLKMKKMY